MEKTKALCETTRQICNASSTSRGLCICWWESNDPEDFRRIALRRINQASKRHLGVKE
jgi:hypothetical protein